VGANAKDLIRGLLQLDPEKRMTIDQYLASPWIMVGISSFTLPYSSFCSVDSIMVIVCNNTNRAKALKINS
jgi:serine/threonine protein kinase